MNTAREQLPSLDSVTTIRADGSRPFLYPADTRGRFTLARRVSAWLLMGVYLALPWIPINGYPAVFLDVSTRRFHLFGATLAAQDLWLLFFLITGAGFSLIFVTALLGRIWCGWACPHTVFLDHVYRRIERWIDGDAVARRRLAEAPLSFTKVGRRILKHGGYILVSAAIAHLFLSYFVSLPQVWSMMHAAPTEHWSAFAFIGIFAGALYFNFAWFREQLCIVICPYGRLQSALIDDHSLVIGYDAQRGEPRGKRPPARRHVSAALAPPATTQQLAAFTAERANEDPPSQPSREGPPSVALASKEGLPSVAQRAKEGDCIDCLRCVHVCPTGIDIRQGLQLECIGCTACIDACDDVMTRLRRPRGLIRYASQNAFAGRPTRWFRPRVIVYGVLLLIGASVASWGLSTLRPANLSVTRITGAPYVVDASAVRNQFFVRLVNKRNTPARFVLRLADTPQGVDQVGLTGPIELGPLAEVVQPLVVRQARGQYTGPFEFDVKVSAAGAAFTLERKVEFLGPEARLLRDDESERAPGP